MNVKNIVLLLLLVFAGTVGAQKAGDKPRLVVGIMVDGLQDQHIRLLWDRFDGNGFRKIASQGAGFERMACNMISSGNASDITSLTTGTVPYYHGVISNVVYNRYSGLYESVFQDRSATGIETELTLSGRNILSTTFVDQLMLANPGQSKSYAIALNAEDAIAMGGHAATSVVWIDDENMKWSGSSYYNGKMPWQALEMNISGGFQRYTNRVWGPLYPPRTYQAALYNTNVKSFEYLPTNKRRERGNRTILKTTPSANALVADLGLKIIREERLGTDNYPDVMMLQFTVRTPKETYFSLQSMEKEDMYLQLDRELQFLIQRIETAVGADQVLFFIYGNQTSTYAPEELKAGNISAGYFNANRSMALLNSYLMAIYGHEKWIEGYYGKHIYLNRKKIEEKSINYNEFYKSVTEFIVQFEGVQSAHNYMELMNTAADPASEMAKVRNSSHRKTAGDIIITLMPGWIELDDNSNPVGESNELISHIPFYFYGWKVVPQQITTRHQITDIAPTLCRILGVAAPNANIGSAMDIQLKTH